MVPASHSGATDEAGEDMVAGPALPTLLSRCYRAGAGAGGAGRNQGQGRAGPARA